MLQNAPLLPDIIRNVLVCRSSKSAAVIRQKFSLLQLVTAKRQAVFVLLPSVWFIQMTAAPNIVTVNVLLNPARRPQVKQDASMVRHLPPTTAEAQELSANPVT